MTPEALDRAARFLVTGDYAAAAAAFEEALIAEPEDPVGLLGAARAHLAATRDDRARTFLLRLLLVRPQHPEALSHLAAIRYRQERQPAQLDELRGLAAHPKAQFPELYNLGVALLRTGLHDEAESALQSARQLVPDSPFVLAQLGKLAFRRGDLPRALRDLARAAEEGPREWYPLRVLSRVHLAAGQLPEAREALDRALERFPDGPILLLDRAQVLLALGEAELALVDARKLAALAPENPQAAHLHGVIALTANQVAEAQQALELAIRLAPQLPDPPMALARLKGLTGETAAEQALLEQALQRAPSHLGLALDLSSFFLRQGAPEALERAATVARTALVHHPEEPGLHLNLALALRNGAPAEALPHARAAATSPKPAIAAQALRLIQALETAHASGGARGGV